MKNGRLPIQSDLHKEAQRALDDSDLAKVREFIDNLPLRDRRTGRAALSSCLLYRLGSSQEKGQSPDVFELGALRATYAGVDEGRDLATEDLCAWAGKLPVEAVEIMINAGANMGGYRFMAPPLVMAIHEDRLDVARLLVHRGAPTSTGVFDSIPLVAAIKQGKREMVECLFEGGPVDLNACIGLDQMPAWFFALRCNSCHLLPYLFENGADINARSKSGSTAFHAWAHNNQEMEGDGNPKENNEILNLLAQRGLDPDVKNNKGETVKEITSQSKNKSLWIWAEAAILSHRTAPAQSVARPHRL